MRISRDGRIVGVVIVLALAVVAMPVLALGRPDDPAAPPTPGAPAAVSATPAAPGAGEQPAKLVPPLPPDAGTPSAGVPTVGPTSPASGVSPAPDGVAAAPSATGPVTVPLLPGSTTPAAGAPTTAPLPGGRATPDAGRSVTVPIRPDPMPPSPSAPNGDAPVAAPSPGQRATPGAPAPAPGGAGMAAGMMKELAPIEGVDVRIAESLPPQYFVDVKYGLPSGCAKPGGYEVARDGERIVVKVFYLRPSDPNVICTMIYGIGTHSVPLGSDFTAGTTYTVDVNGTTKTFTAQ